MQLDFDVTDCTNKATPSAIKTPTPRPAVVGAAVPVACKPSCLIFGGCEKCRLEMFDDETQVAQ